MLFVVRVCWLRCLGIGIVYLDIIWDSNRIKVYKNKNNVWDKLVNFEEVCKGGRIAWG